MGARQLQKHDVFDPLGGYDTHMDLTQLPAGTVLRFWRPSASFLKFRSPLWDVLPPQNLLVDLLHTVDLGVCQYVGGHIMAFILREDLLQSGARSMKVRQSLQLPMLNARYSQWFRSPGWGRDESSRITELGWSNLLGTGGLKRPSLGAKGAESRALFLFLADLLQEVHVHATPSKLPTGKTLLGAAKCLALWLQIVVCTGGRMPAELLDQAAAQQRNCCTLFRSGGGALRPKFHQWRHLTLQQYKSGNCRMTSTYTDETFNQLVVRFATRAKPARFAISVLEHYFLLQLARGMQA